MFFHRLKEDLETAKQARKIPEVTVINWILMECQRRWPNQDASDENVIVLLKQLLNIATNTHRVQSQNGDDAGHMRQQVQILEGLLQEMTNL